MKKVIVILIVLILAFNFSIAGCNRGLSFNESEFYETTSLKDGNILVKAELFGMAFESVWPQDVTADHTDFYKILQEFSYEIFKASDEGDENRMVSPASVFLALAMTLNGADGDTKDEMINALKARGLSDEDINMAARDFQILARKTSGNTKLQIQNSVWYREGFIPDTDFIQKNVDYYKAVAKALDFDDEKSADIINSWVSEATNGTIEEIIDSISPDAVMYLINAIYFNGKWETPFSGEDTYEGNFYTGDSSVNAKFMNRIGDMDYIDYDDAKGVILPYDDERFVFLALIPKEGYETEDIKEYFSGSNLENIFTVSTEKKVDLSLLKFESEYETEMNDILKSLGMKKAFSPGEADFSLMNENRERNLFIEQVKHKTFIRVDEEGTEASAVTSVEIRMTSIPSSEVTLRFDRPFIYAVLDTKTNVTLFMGVMDNPG